jgi:predicted transcriptional regulator
MDPAEKVALKEKLAEKGIDFDKAAQELNVSASLLTLYLKEDSNPVPKRIIDGLNKMTE